MNHAVNTRPIETTPTEAFEAFRTDPARDASHEDPVTIASMITFFNTAHMSFDTLMTIAWGAIEQTLDADHDLELENHGSDHDQSHRIIINLPSGGHIAGPWVSQITSGINLDLTGTDLFKSMAGALIESANRAINAARPMVEPQQTPINTTPIKLTETQIETAIRTSTQWGGSVDTPVTSDMLEQFGGYFDHKFTADSVRVLEALVSGPLSGTHALYIVWTDEPGGDYSNAQVQVPLPLGGYITASEVEADHITDDRDAKGINGLIAMATALIRLANDSLDLAKPLIELQLATNK